MRASMALLVVGALALTGCGGDADLIETAGTVGAADRDAEPDDADTDDDADAAEDDAAEADEPVVAPGRVTGQIGVEYQATGGLTERFTLIQGGEVSVFRTDEFALFVEPDRLVACPTGEGCNAMPRDLAASMGLLGGEIVEDVTSFATEVEWRSGTAETIAGREARCLVPDGVAVRDGSELEAYCYDVASGIALRWTVVEEGARTEVEAVRVFEPSDAELSPTGPVQELDLDGLPDLEGLELPGMGP